jgi:hypothetical protein
MEGKQDHGPYTQADAQQHPGVQELSLVQEGVAQPHREQVIPEGEERRAAQAEGNRLPVPVRGQAVPTTDGHDGPVEAVLIEGHGQGQGHREAHGELEQQQFRLRILRHDRFQQERPGDIGREHPDHHRHIPGHHPPLYLENP